MVIWSVPIYKQNKETMILESIPPLIIQQNVYKRNVKCVFNTLLLILAITNNWARLPTGTQIRKVKQKKTDKNGQRDQRISDNTKNISQLYAR